MKKFIGKKIIMGMLAIICILTLFVGCSSNAKVVSIEVEGYFWKATKEGKEIYLGGTMHPSPSNVNYLNDKFNTILNDTDAIAVEVDITDENILKEIQEKSEKLIYQNKGDIERQLDPKEFENLKKLCNDLDIKYSTLSNLTAYGIKAVTESVILNKIDYIGEACDSVWAKVYKKENKMVSSLETIDGKVNESRADSALENLKESLKVYDGNILENKKIIRIYFLRHFKNQKLNMVKNI